MLLTEFGRLPIADTRQQMLILKEHTELKKLAEDRVSADKKTEDDTEAAHKENAYLKFMAQDQEKRLKVRNNDNRVLRSNNKAQETINRAQTRNIVELENSISELRDEIRELRRADENFKAVGQNSKPLLTEERKQEISNRELVEEVASKTEEIETLKDNYKAQIVTVKSYATTIVSLETTNTLLLD